jgi:hypothetical protein
MSHLKVRENFGGKQPIHFNGITLNRQQANAINVFVVDETSPPAGQAG